MIYECQRILEDIVVNLKHSIVFAKTDENSKNLKTPEDSNQYFLNM